MIMGYAASRSAGDAVSRVIFNDDYFSRVRYDVLRHVPEGVRTVLSVGCGSGATESELIKQGIHVHAIEMNADAAAAARGRGVEVLEGDAAAISGRLRHRTFDCVIYADVLEHMVDPLTVLLQHVQCLRPGGAVIISVPNFRHYSVLAQLFLDGHVRYENAGIFDRTHLRITTRKMVQEWVSVAGLRPMTIEYRMSRRREKLLAAFSLGLLSEFVARQVIVVATKVSQ